MKEGKTDSARIVLDRCMELFPHERVGFNYFLLPVIENYFAIGDTEKATHLVIKLSDVIEEELRYFLRTDRELMVDQDFEKQVRMHIMQELLRFAEESNQDELAKKQLELFQELVNLYSLSG